MVLRGYTINNGSVLGVFLLNIFFFFNELDKYEQHF